ncbi:MAG: IS3 family transposase [Gemmatimonadales bacterium]
MIHQFRSQYPIELMCRVLEVSHGGYYAWRGRAPCARAVTDVDLQVRIAASHRRSRGTYGSPRILRDLQDEGITISRKRVARLLRAAGLRGVTRRRFRVLSQEGPNPVAPKRAQPGLCGRRAESGLGRGCHLPDHGRGVAVSGRRHRSPFPPGRRLGHECAV